MAEFDLHDKLVNCKICSIAKFMKYCEKYAFRDVLIIIKAEKEGEKILEVLTKLSC